MCPIKLQGRTCRLRCPRASQRSLTANAISFGGIAVHWLIVYMGWVVVETTTTVPDVSTVIIPSSLPCSYDASDVGPSLRLQPPRHSFSRRASLRLCRRQQGVVIWGIRGRYRGLLDKARVCFPIFVQGTGDHRYDNYDQERNRESNFHLSSRV